MTRPIIESLNIMYSNPDLDTFKKRFLKDVELDIETLTISHVFFPRLSFMSCDMDCCYNSVNWRNRELQI